MKYGIDVQNMLESILVDELTKSIDDQIMKSLSGNRQRIEKIKKIKDKIKQIREK
jgi:hypothetical protein